MSTSRVTNIERIRVLPEKLRERVKPFTPEQLTTHYVEGEWTIAQNVHHLADTHMNCFRRFKFIINTDDFLFTQTPVDAWADMADGNNADIEDSLMILDGLHKRWVTLIENMTPEDWEKTGRHYRSGDLSLEYLVNSYANHGENHLKQIQDVIDAMPA